MKDSSETTSLKDETTRNPEGMKEKREQAKVKAKAKVVSKLEQSDENKFKCMTVSVCICATLFLVSFVSINVWYYNSVFEERDIIDEKEVLVSEQWIDYTTNELANCTNLHPCREWNCHYIDEHFHKNPDECEYDDWLIVWYISISICGCCIMREICN